MSVEVAGGLLGLKSTAKLALYADEGPKDQKRKSVNGSFSEEEEEDERSDTSSIGACSSGGEEEDEEVQSKENEENKSSLSSLDSLEDSLPDKRGLSNFYSGKSKSFTSLSNASNATAKDLIKPENPFNKRRRVLMAWSRRRASCGSLISMATSSLPPLISSEETLEEGEEGEEEEEFEEKRGNLERRNQLRPSIFTPIWKNEESIKAKMPLRSPRCFSLSDLNKHDLID